jgi:hypothetical protein
MKPGDDTEGLQIALVRWATRSHFSVGVGGWDPYRLGPWLAGFMAGLHGLPWVDPGMQHASARVGYDEGCSERRIRERDRSET